MGPGTRSVVLVGLGPHARRIYYPMLARAAATHGVRIALLIELDDQRDTVRDYLAAQDVQPDRVVMVPESNRGDVALHPTALAALQALGPRPWGMVVATEPRSHLMYAQWALDNGVHLLLDKPITARSLVDADAAEALRLVDDFYQLLDAAARTGAHCLVQTQRRCHRGYELVRAYLREFLGAFGVPVTYLDVYHADGMWNMPAEFFSRENHSYKYGYGKIMHSGYHFLDLMTWLLSVNDELPATAPDRFEFTTRQHTPADFLRQVGHDQYQRMFGAEAAVMPQFAAEHSDRLRRFGETDIHLLGQFRRGDAAMTTVALNLLQTSFSRRAWLELPRDTYKGNGRVRHERVTIQVGHLLSVQVHSYQSYEAAERADDTGPGHYDHFEVYIFRNAALVGGAPFERIDIGGAMAADQRTDGVDGHYLGHNEAARGALLHDFLAADPDRAGLDSHELPVKLAASTYYGVRLAADGRLPAGTGMATSIDLNAKRTGWLSVDGTVVAGSEVTQ